MGTGWNLAELKCKRRLGYDLSEHLEPVLASRGIEFLKDITTVADGSIDVVICHHVLEHTDNPSEVLEKIKCVLHPNGKLLCLSLMKKKGDTAVTIGKSLITIFIRGMCRRSAISLRISDSKSQRQTWAGLATIGLQRFGRLGLVWENWLQIHTRGDSLAKACF